MMQRAFHALEIVFCLYARSCYNSFSMLYDLRRLQESILEGAKAARVATGASAASSPGGGFQDDERATLVDLGDLTAANKWARQDPFPSVPSINIGSLTRFINTLPQDRFGPIKCFATALRDGLDLSLRDQIGFLAELRFSSLGMLIAQGQADQQSVYLTSKASKLSDIVVPSGSIQCDVQGRLRVRTSRLSKSVTMPLMRDGEYRPGSWYPIMISNCMSCCYNS